MDANLALSAISTWWGQEVNRPLRRLAVIVLLLVIAFLLGLLVG